MLSNSITYLVLLAVTGNNDVNQLFSFNLDEDKNQLIKIAGSINDVSKYPIVSIGKITGRQEAVYKLQNKQNNLFVLSLKEFLKYMAGRYMQGMHLAYGIYLKT